MENSNMIQLPMNNLGRVIYYREKYDVSQAEVADIIGITPQGWSVHEKKYKSSYISAQEKWLAILGEKNTESDNNDSPIDVTPYLEMVHDYPFTPQQIHRLNILLRPPLEDALEHPNSPMVFDEHAILMAALRDARYRDGLLTQNILECVAGASEENLGILRQTVDILIGIDDVYPYKVEKTAFLLSAIRNHVTGAIHRVISNDECLDKFVEKYLPIAKEKARERLSQTHDSKELPSTQKYENCLRIELKHMLSQQLFESIEASIKKDIGRATETLVDDLVL